MIPFNARTLCCTRSQFLRVSTETAGKFERPFRSLKTPYKTLSTCTFSGTSYTYHARDMNSHWKYGQIRWYPVMNTGYHEDVEVCFPCKDK